MADSYRTERLDITATAGCGDAEVIRAAIARIYGLGDEPEPGTVEVRGSRPLDHRTRVYFVRARVRKAPT